MGRALGRSRWLLRAAAAALLGLGGCASLDDFSLKRFFQDPHQVMAEMRDPEEPLAVARKSEDGALRAREIGRAHV